MKVAIVGEWLTKTIAPDLAQIGRIPYPAKWDSLFTSYSILDREDFPIGLARVKAAQLTVDLATNHEKVILLGRKIESAFAIPETPWFQWHERWGLQFVCVPSPIRESRWWNLIDHRAMAHKFWSNMVQEETHA